MLRVIRRAGRPKQRKAHPGTGMQLTHQFGKPACGPALCDAPRTQVHANQGSLRGGRAGRAGHSMPQACSHCGIRQQHAGRWRPFDAKWRQQAKHVSGFVQQGTVAIHHRLVDAARRKLFRGETRHAARAQPAHHVPRVALRARPGQDHMINARRAQTPQQARRVRVHRQPRFLGPMLGFVVGINRVEVRIALQHRRVVTIDQRANPGVRMVLTQRADQGRGQHQVADVVAADHQVARAWTHRSTGGLMARRHRWQRRRSLRQRQRSL